MNMSAIIADYQTKRYSLAPEPPESHDCWTLVVDGRRRIFGLATPFELSDDTHLSARKSTEDHPWIRVEDPMPGDVIMAAKFPLLRLHHCGMALDGAVLHAHAQILLTSMAAFRRYYRRIEIWRLKSE